jgi:cell division transport system ATP-binding protein
MHLLLSLHRLGTTVVVATHNNRMVRQHGFPVLQMSAGRLLAPAPAASALAIGA